ncbi:synaptic vesicular amine transporter isoform X2 [Lingula anatina]|uniref:Synaptic vesicular amine transporter isoform X2 n=2 Tax=Lingula anatina TaxID=7574 RepID=A0A1S3JNB0_LINAN|nr:synaptic vesicular amine transporter isoform X2 [Lingula anatina]|eukprot:XP_013411845.1 synaptic vesicular amine transporter isoform X2 [Lingula anatina]
MTLNIKEQLRNFTVKDCFAKCRQSRTLVLVVVFIAIFLDNMLLTTVVPIIPNFLYHLDHPDLVAASRNLSSIRHSLNISRQGNETYQNVTVLYKKQCTDHNATTRSNFTWDEVVKHYIPKVDLPDECYEIRYLMTVLAENATTVEDNIDVEAVMNATEEVAKKRHLYLVNESVKVGLLFASKAVVQLLTNPFIGPLTNRIGYSIPMFTGFVIMFVSTIIFAFAESFWLLLMARAVQGVGSSCSSVSGMGMIAEVYPDDNERGHAMGIALSGLALGVLIGPPFGGVMYQFAGKEAPFLILAALALFDGLLQLIVLKPRVTPECQEGASLKNLLTDPYILLAAGAITFANMGIAMLEPSLPIWMLDTMNAPEWQQGTAFLPASISYMIGTNTFGPLANKIGRWLSSLIGMIIIGCCLVAIPICATPAALIPPMAGLGFSIGMVDSSMMPHMGYLVDTRHTSVYGSVYAIADVAFCVGYAFGPSMCGTIVKLMGFPWMLWGMAIVVFLYSPLVCFLRQAQVREETLALIMKDKCPIQYVTQAQNYSTLDEAVSPDERP